MSSRTWSENHRQANRRASSRGVLGVFLRGVAESFPRARQRHNLAALSDHALRDIGLTRGDVDLEVGKPFWRG